MQLFYTPDIINNKYTLNEQESKHCTRVLRLLRGDYIHLTDGVGTLYKAEISVPNPKACELIIIDKFTNYNQRSCKLHIAIAPTKSMDRFEWFLEKVTEIGVDEITPLVCEHSERKVVKPERLERIVIAAMKQSLKAYKPIINPMCSYQNFMESNYANQQCFIAHCQEGKKEKLKDALTANNICLLIGPEGDFSLEEVGLAAENNFQSISLGRERLRTETAGIVAAHTVNLMINT